VLSFLSIPEHIHNGQWLIPLFFNPLLALSVHIVASFFGIAKEIIFTFRYIGEILCIPQAE